MKLKKIFFTILILLLLCGCAKSNVRISFDNSDACYELTDIDKSKIKKDALLILNSNQNLIFFDLNKFFESGTYRIDKQEVNMFSRRVYLVNKSTFYENSFVNTTKIKMNDVKYGEIYINLTGNYDFKITDSMTFINGYINYKGDAYNYINFLINNECLKYFSELAGETYTVLSYNSSAIGSNIVNKLNNKNYGIEFSNMTLKIDLTDDSKENVDGALVNG